jgi:agmatinase
VGIRSFTPEEASAAQNLYPFEVSAHIPQLISRLKDRPCYLSLDLDLLNPAELPGVSTPAPGGISYQELLQALDGLSQLFWVGVDLVEHNPLASSYLGCGVLVAEILREVILTLFPKRR